YKAQEIMGQHFSRFYPPEAIESRFPWMELETAARVGRFEDEGWRLRKDGTKFWANVVITALRDDAGKLRGFAKVTRDLTERKRMERVRVQAEMLADLNRRKDEFLAMLSHELRNPLAPIMTSVQLLRGESDTDPVHRQTLDILERQTGHLTRLVNDLLDVARISTGRIQIHLGSHDLRTIAQRAVDSNRLLITQKHLELSVSLADEPVWVHVDPTRMEQVVVNLLANAIKYANSSGGRIHVSVETEADQAVLRVSDNGIGIDAEFLPHIFDLFTQSDQSLDRAQGGLGIGLTVVRRIVELHGGKVSAASGGRGEGSEFTIRIPLSAPRETENRPDAETSSAAPRQKSVLLVDDNKDAADGLALLLRRSGGEVRVAYSARSALEVLAGSKPSVILLDIGLPEIDGYELARRIRGDPAHHGVRLVALTGYGRESYQKRSVEAGFDVHLVKPVQLEDLEQALA
ncbi:MAG TPA: ATP-binding protein, partial [Phycisphaerae bacterium]|nr:ATP-binding protein [Phycisphaerae bacterium]